MGFRGFPERALQFYAELAADNSREFWQTHKKEYEAAVREPMEALAGELDDEFGPIKLFRPNRDVRFSRDKSPYKTYQAAIAGEHAGIGYYVQLDASGLTVGGGFHAHSTAQTTRLRAAVDDEATGDELVAVMAGLRRRGYRLDGEQVKTAPRGYPVDHPRIELLRYKELMVSKDLGAPAWLRTSKALERVRSSWREVTPLQQWVRANAGPP